MRGATCCERITVLIAIAQIDEFDMIANTGEQDIVGFEVEMQHLVLVQIAHRRAYFHGKLTGMFLIFEIIRMLLVKICQRHAINIFHQEIISMKLQIVGNIGVVQGIAYFKLLFQGLTSSLFTCQGR